MATCTTTETDCDRWRRELADARTALHELRLGGTVVRISSGDGKTLEFSPGTVRDLQAYVTELQWRVAGCSGGCRRGRAIQLIPG